MQENLIDAAPNITQQDYALTVTRITHSYQNNGAGMQVLDHVSLALQRETFTCLIGPSGCGKSTLLRVVSGLLRPDVGRVHINGLPFQNHGGVQIGMVFQDANLMPWRTVKQNLVLPLELAGVPRREQNARADAILEMLGLSEFHSAYPSALSGGMAQRLAIGRALIHDPDVLLLDEPFGALDAITREQVSEELLHVWARDRKTVLMVTHSIPEAILLADRVLVMSPRPGRIIADFAVNLPRPRHADMVTDADFVSLEAQVRAALRVR